MLCSNSYNTKKDYEQVRRIGCQVLCRKCSTEKCPRAGKGNFQHAELLGKGDIKGLSKKDECLDLRAGKRCHSL